MKIVIVGSNHAGIAAANTILDNNPEADVVMIDQNTNMSYLGCGTALWVGRQIESYEPLFYTNEEDFRQKGACIHLETTVLDIDFQKREVSCQKAQDRWNESYDKLILATGSLPISLNIPGADLEGIHYLKLFQEGQTVDRALDLPNVKNVAVIGGGYIGVEIAEAVRRRGKNVMIFDAAETTLSNYYDETFTKDMDFNLTAHGIQLHLGELAKAYEGEKRVETLKTDKGKYSVDMVISAVGFRANNDLGKNHLITLPNGAYLVNTHQQTSDSSVYAVGDCASIYSNALDKTTYIALASNAVRTGIVAGYNAIGTKLEGNGVQGSNGISIYGLNMVSTGLSVKVAEKAGLKVSYVDHVDLQKPAFMKENASVKIRIVYENESRRIVGAQVSSMENISMLIHLFSLAIEEKVTIDKLKLMDLFFLPHFDQPYNYITMAALKAK
ncbi:FAD-dependent oxidoreductase [Lactococcus lactis]|uniref:H2O-forming NADH oxidase n=1 Tax=Lactococcus lactis TaxID=1358 RepID=UPI0029394319|nr:FAD-dependent oxidoreductase [Lactococcus lactis]WOF40805.1 FAD-dependent oxidoreductase [Lactococcus lactis]